MFENYLGHNKGKVKVSLRSLGLSQTFDQLYANYQRVDTENNACCSNSLRNAKNKVFARLKF